MINKNISGYFIAIAFAFFTLTSCTKEDVVKAVAQYYDNRDSVAVGFTGTLITTKSGIPTSETKTVNVSKGADGKLIIAVANDVTFNTDLAIGTKSSLACSVPKQDVSYKGDSATIEGVGVIGQHFIYTAQLNKLTFGATITVGSTTKTIAFTGSR